MYAAMHHSIVVTGCSYAPADANVRLLLHHPAAAAVRYRYALISYVGTCDSEIKSAAGVKKQAKLIPELVFVVDKFEAAVVT